MTNKKTEFIVGLFVLLGILALLFLALRAGNLSSFSFNKNYTVIAKFDNIGSLKERAPIKSSGVLIGRVSAITFDNQEFKAIVRMDVNERYRFPEDTSATIKTSGILGEQYVEFTPGAEEKNLHDGSQIIYTQGAIVLEDLISKFLYSTAEKQGTEAPKKPQ